MMKLMRLWQLFSQTSHITRNSLHLLNKRIIDKRKYKMMHAAEIKIIILLFSWQRSRFFKWICFSAIVFILFSLQCLYIIRKNWASLYLLRLYLKAFIHSYKIPYFICSYCSVYLCFISGDSYCLLSYQSYYFLLFIYLFIFWFRAPGRWVNSSEWNHNAAHVGNIHRGRLILSYHM